MDPLTLEQGNCQRVVFFTLIFAALAGGQVLAPLDVDVECLNSSVLPSNVVLLDSYLYTSLENLWFADDESIDLFAFPVPEDPVRWQLVDQSECRNVWQYCGDSASDILITQFISGDQNSTSNEVVVSVEYAFFNSSGLSVEPQSSAIIVEIDDTTGLGNIHTEYIPRCVNDTAPSRHDFLYTPMYRYFEMVFRSNLSEGICVNISRVRVFYCGTNYPVVRDKDTSTAQVITCSACPDHSTFLIGRCECEVGHQRSDHANFSLPCDQCANGYFMAVNGSCIPCPLPGFYNNPNSMVDTCQCFNATLSTDLTCQFCAANHYRNISVGECVLCPAGSRRPVVFDDSGVPLAESESSCTCTEGSLTRDGENITNRQLCDVCGLLYWNGTQCVVCPANSHVFVADPIQCACDADALTLTGQNTTTVQQCFCMSGLYRAPGLDGCQSCPSMSFRALGDPEHICACFGGHRRENDTHLLPCFLYVGFNTTTLTLREGNGEQAHCIPIFLSHASEGAISVRVHVRTNGDWGVQISDNVTFLPTAVGLCATLSYTGNAIALEEDVILNLYLSQAESALLVGGPELFGDLTVTIRDDDLLHVGFTENSLVLESSEQSGRVGINISTDIGMSLLILIRTNDSLSPDVNPHQPREVTFLASNATSMFFEFDVGVNRDSTRYILISLEVATYPESLNRVRNRITVGEFPGFYREVVVAIQEDTGADGLSGPVAAVIGFVSLAVFLCIVVVVVILVFCLCCKQRLTKRVLPGSEYEEIAMETESSKEDNGH